mmetsp:Transcript_2437/g.9186  ORF Transcript_2437/g.9186 Transcript_2437/m.9186 type:complete len:231 (-) Transcript_2437:4010-4702(-)
MASFKPILVLIRHSLVDQGQMPTMREILQPKAFSDSFCLDLSQYYSLKQGEQVIFYDVTKLIVAHNALGMTANMPAAQQTFMLNKYSDLEEFIRAFPCQRSLEVAAFILLQEQALEFETTYIPVLYSCDGVQDETLKRKHTKREFWASSVSVFTKGLTLQQWPHILEYTHTSSTHPVHHCSPFESHTEFQQSPVPCRRLCSDRGYANVREDSWNFWAHCSPWMHEEHCQI